MPRKSAFIPLIGLRLIAAACEVPAATPALASSPSPISIAVARDDFAYQFAVAGTSTRLPWCGELAILAVPLIWRRRAHTL